MLSAQSAETPVRTSVDPMVICNVLNAGRSFLLMEVSDGDRYPTASGD